MKLLVLSVLLAGALAAPQGYQLPTPGNKISFADDSAEAFGGFSERVISPRSFEDDSSHSAESSLGSRGGYRGGNQCTDGLVAHYDGSCVEPIVSRNIYLYAAPKIQYQPGPKPIIPKPRVNYNIVFVRTPEIPDNREPIVIPPAQEQTLVYVLSKNQQLDQQVIEVPDLAPRAPEVYYVNYNEGENPQLPGGLDLQSALASAVSAEGQFVENAGSGRFDEFDGSQGFTKGSQGFSQGSFEDDSREGFGRYSAPAQRIPSNQYGFA